MYDDLHFPTATCCMHPTFVPIKNQRPLAASSFLDEETEVLCSIVAKPSLEPRLPKHSNAHFLFHLTFPF